MSFSQMLTFNEDDDDEEEETETVKADVTLEDDISSAGDEAAEKSMLISRHKWFSAIEDENVYKCFSFCDLNLQVLRTVRPAAISKKSMSLISPILSFYVQVHLIN